MHGPLELAVPPEAALTIEDLDQLLMATDIKPGDGPGVEPAAKAANGHSANRTGPIEYLPQRGFKGPGNRRAYRATDLLNGRYLDIVRVRQGEKCPLLPGWQNHQMTMDEGAALDAAKDSIGLRGTNFPAIDADALKERVAKLIQDFVEKRWPGIPIRFGNHPKFLVQFRLEEGAEPIGNWVLSIEGTGRQQIEMRGGAGQHVISGFHPVTRHLYDWVRPLPLLASMLPTLNRAEAVQFFADLREHLAQNGIVCKRSTSGGGGGAAVDRSKIDQESLKAKDLGALKRAMAVSPNDYDDRATWRNYGTALKAATQDDPDLGLALYLEWSAKWEGGEGNDPDHVQDTWNSLHGPFEFGADWIYERARDRGDFNWAAEVFDVVSAAERALLPGEAFQPAGDPSGIVAVVREGSMPDLSDMMSRTYRNDRGNALRFLRIHGANVRFCPDLKRWLYWDGMRWRWDTVDATRVRRVATEAMFEFSGQAVRHHSDDRKELVNFAVTSGNAGRIDALLRIAQTLAGVTVEVKELDPDPFLLGVENGVIDLRTGQLQLPRRENFITKSVGFDYSPDAACPVFRKLLDDVFEGDPGMLEFYPEMMGYCATGSTQEKAAFYHLGPSNCGKSTVLGGFRESLGEYAVSLPIECLLSLPGRESSFESTALANLIGKRLAITTEPPGGAYLNENRFKQLVPNGDGRFDSKKLYENTVTTRITAKLACDANHELSTRSGTGVHERMKVLPFRQVIPEERQDKALPEKLAEERSGILAVAVAGAVRWYKRGGLILPERSVAAGRQYQDSQESTGAWKRECLDFEPGAKTSSAELSQSFSFFCRKTGKPTVTDTALGAKYVEWDLTRTRLQGGRAAWLGVRIRGEFAEAVDEGGSG